MHDCGWRCNGSERSRYPVIVRGIDRSPGQDVCQDGDERHDRQHRRQYGVGVGVLDRGLVGVLPAIRHGRRCCSLLRLRHDEHLGFECFVSGRGVRVRAHAQRGCLDGDDGRARRHHGRRLDDRRNLYGWCCGKPANGADQYQPRSRRNGVCGVFQMRMN